MAPAGPERCGRRGGLTMSAVKSREGECWVDGGGSPAPGYVAPFSPPASMAVQRSRSQTAATESSHGPQGRPGGAEGAEAAPTCEDRAGQGRRPPAACSPSTSGVCLHLDCSQPGPPVGLSGSGLCPARDNQGWGASGASAEPVAARLPPGSTSFFIFKNQPVLSSRHRKLNSTVSAAQL